MTTHGFKERIERALTAPGEELGRWAQFARFQARLWRFCARRLRENNVAAMSAALSYRTIFAIIPVLVLALLVLKSVGALEDSRQSVRSFLDASGFAQIVALRESDSAAGEQPETAATQPAEVINVADKIEEIVAQVEGKLTFERIGPIGGALLIWTALTLLTTMERSLNRIFGATRSRSLARRILLYWSAMTLGPLALTAASYLGRDVVDTFRNAPGMSWLLVAIGWAGPIVVGVLILSALYKLLPNTTVRNRAAVGGAVVAVPLWLLAKWGFAVYVQRLVITGNLYGVLGVLPLFLLWLNVSWLIFLFGAQLAHAAANLSRMQSPESEDHVVVGPSDMLAAALAVAQPYHAGEGLATFDRVAAKLRLPAESVQWLLDRLGESGVIRSVDDESGPQYVLARPAGKTEVAEVLRTANPRREPSGRDARSGYSSYEGRDGQIAAAVAEVERRTRSSLADLTLADMLTSDP